MSLSISGLIGPFCPQSLLPMWLLRRLVAATVDAACHSRRTTGRRTDSCSRACAKTYHPHIHWQLMIASKRSRQDLRLVTPVCVSLSDVAGSSQQTQQYAGGSGCRWTPLVVRSLHVPIWLFAYAWMEPGPVLTASSHRWPSILHDGIESDSMPTYEYGSFMPHCGHVISRGRLTSLSKELCYPGD